MAKHKEPQIHKDITGVNIKGEEITLQQSLPQQLSLFQSFFGEVVESKSNTIELYDVMPMYTPSRKIAGMREHEKYLPTMIKNFKHKDQLYKLTLSPARVMQKDDSEKEYYPSEREELIEQALRKICVRQSQGLYLNGMVGVQFYLNELKSELAAMGHDMHYAAIIEGLKVGNLCNVEASKENSKKPLISSPIFPLLMLSTRDEWEQSPDDAKCYVQFNPLVTASIDELTFRQFNYVQGMGISSILGRWLYRRMCHNYTNASIRHPYRIKASTIVQDSGLEISTFRKAVQTIDKMINDFREKSVVIVVDKEPVYEISENGRKQLADVIYTLTPHPSFTDDIVNANKRNSVLKPIRD